LLGESILSHGLPVARVRGDSVTGLVGDGVNVDGLCVLHPPLPMYLAGGSFALF